MELQEQEVKIKKIGYETFDLLKNKKIKMFVPSGIEILDFTADKDYTAQVSIVLTEKKEKL